MSFRPLSTIAINITLRTILLSFTRANSRANCKVDYPKRSRAKIVEAYFRQASTTDYSGVLKDIILILKRKRHAKSIHAHEKFSCASDRTHETGC